MIKKYILNPIIYTFVLGFIIFEEYVWDKIFKHIYLKIKSLELMNKFRIYVENEDHRYKLLGIFLIPFILMEGMSTIGLILMGKGMFITGLTLYIGKLFVTVPVVVIFNAAKKKLLSFIVIKYVYGFILKMKRSSFYRNTKHKIVDLKISLKEKIIQLKKEFNIENRNKFKEKIIRLFKTIKAKRKS